MKFYCKTLSHFRDIADNPKRIKSTKEEEPLTGIHNLRSVTAVTLLVYTQVVSLKKKLYLSPSSVLQSGMSLLKGNIQPKAV